ncbi:DNA helicase UvrD [bacterium]|nr:DNA helicase UvrD [bacterium]
MKFIADFHIHSKYSRATSPKIDLDSLAKFALLKGVDVLGTGDFTHPQWYQSLKEELKPSEEGLFRLKDKPSRTRFILTSEISCIYSKNGRTRKIHVLIFSPDIQTVKKINDKLGKIGNLKADGRPILGLDAKELLKIVLDINENCFFVPAHLMTPWFSVFGSRSGFDSLEECFQEYSKYIYAGETGLSADPGMLWRIKDGRRITLISNSDAHSLCHIGREANVFDTELDYFSIIEAIKAKDKRRFLYTIEFYPQEGKYYFDGHRECGVSFSPEESKRHNNICPKCGRPLTIGVLNRVEQLSDKPKGFRPKDAIPFKSLVPLDNIIAEALGVGVGTKQVAREYNNLIEKFDNEFNVLLNVSQEELQTTVLPEIAQGIIMARRGDVSIKPGYDGEYGKIKILGKIGRDRLNRQKTLF